MKSETIWPPEPKICLTRAVMALFQASAATTPNAADANAIMVCTYAGFCMLVVLFTNKVCFHLNLNPKTSPTSTKRAKRFWREVLSAEKRPGQRRVGAQDGCPRRLWEGPRRPVAPGLPPAPPRRDSQAVARSAPAPSAGTGSAWGAEPGGSR